VKVRKALGIIETYGLITAIEAADAAVKAANVELIGYELAQGAGLTTVKVVGDVGGVKAAMSAANAAASKVGKVISTHVIPRPHDNIEILIESKKPTDAHRSKIKTDRGQKSTCNLCEDPMCPRKKGDPRVKCIHYREEDH